MSLYSPEMSLVNPKTRAAAGLCGVRFRDYEEGVTEGRKSGAKKPGALWKEGFYIVSCMV